MRFDTGFISDWLSFCCQIMGKNAHHATPKDQHASRGALALAGRVRLLRRGHYAREVAHSPQKLIPVHWLLADRLLIQRDNDYINDS